MINPAHTQYCHGYILTIYKIPVIYFNHIWKTILCHYFIQDQYGLTICIHPLYLLIHTVTPTSVLFYIYKSLPLFSQTHWICLGFFFFFNHELSIAQYLLLKLKYAWERVQKTSRKFCLCIQHFTECPSSKKGLFPFVLMNISSPKGASSCKTKEPSPGCP